MSTSQEVVQQLQQAHTNAQNAKKSVDNLIAEHDYQDVATLMIEASIALLESSIALMQSQDENAIQHLENAEDLLDAFYDILNGDLDEE